MGVHIIDVGNCTEVAFGKGRSFGSFVIHRDFKVYKNYLFAVCDEGKSALQVFDLSYLPDSLHQVFESDTSEFMTCHNIFIDTARGSLYAAYVRKKSGGLVITINMQVYDISDPAHPVWLTDYFTGDNVHDIYVRNDTAYCSSGVYGYEVVDFSAHDGSYQKLGEMLFYPYKGYNHSSWINDKGIGVMADETHGLPLKMIDVRNPGDMEVLSVFSPRPNDTTCIPHNPYLKNDFAFISYYFDGFQIYDVSDPLNPVRAGYYDTYPGPNFKGYAGAWGCYPFLPSGKVLVSDMQTGLYVLDVSDAIHQGDTTRPRDGFELIPNPFTDLVQLRFPLSDTGSLSFTLLDISGKKIWEQDKNLFSYTIQPIELILPRDLPPGMYFMNIRTSRNFYSHRITKQ